MRISDCSSDVCSSDLLAPNVAGKAGVMLSERSPFRGRTLSGDVDGYITDILAETDMRLGVCDWGYCLYRRETSACLGGESSEERRVGKEGVMTCRSRWSPYL